MHRADKRTDLSTPRATMRATVFVEMCQRSATSFVVSNSSTRVSAASIIYAPLRTGWPVQLPVRSRFCFADSRDRCEIMMSFCPLNANSLFSNTPRRTRRSIMDRWQPSSRAASWGDGPFLLLRHTSANQSCISTIARSSGETWSRGVIALPQATHISRPFGPVALWYAAPQDRHQPLS